MLNVPTINIRATDEQKSEIERRAGARGMTLTQFLLAAALIDDLAETADARRLERIEVRLVRLEDVTFGRV
jgi:uncharacterized protein (DUF1778 family)